MQIYHIGTIAFENKTTRRELKSIGGITGYILELINYSLSKKLKIGFVGKIYNYLESKHIKYIQVQNNITSTNKFLIHLFFKSITVRIPKNAIIHAHRPDHLAVFILFNNRKSVITLHGQQASLVNIRKGPITRFIYKTLEHYALKKTNALIAVDHITQDFYSNLYPRYKNKIHTVPTGVNTKLFYPLERENSRNFLAYSNTDKIIIYVGRIEPPKKINSIIKAFQILVNQDNSYKLVIVGDGVLMEDSKSLALKLNLKENIHFLGVRKRMELPQLFSSADVSILISGNEGSPLSVKESLACGVPVIANDVGDISEIVKNSHNGYIVDSENIDEIAEALKLATNDSLNMRQNCIDSIQDFSTEKVSEKVINLYKKIFNE